MNRWNLCIALSAFAPACASNSAPPAGAPATAPAVAAAAATVEAAAGTALTPPPRKDDADRKSKNGRLAATVGGVPVILQYGRPKVRDRPIYGKLIRYGEVWRTGADEATTLTVAKNATIEGEALPAGTYSLFTIPSANNWLVVVNRVAAQWGAYNYDAKQDVLRVHVTPVAHEMTDELTFSAQGDVVFLDWEKLRVPIRIRAAK